MTSLSKEQLAEYQRCSSQRLRAVLESQYRRLAPEGSAALKRSWLATQLAVEPALIDYRRALLLAKDAAAPLWSLIDNGQLSLRLALSIVVEAKRRSRAQSASSQELALNLTRYTASFMVAHFAKRYPHVPSFRAEQMASELYDDLRCLFDAHRERWRVTDSNSKPRIRPSVPSKLSPPGPPQLRVVK